MKELLLLLIQLAMPACFLLLVVAVLCGRTQTDRTAHGAQVPDLGGDA